MLAFLSLNCKPGTGSTDSTTFRMQACKHKPLLRIELSKSPSGSEVRFPDQRPMTTFFAIASQETSAANVLLRLSVEPLDTSDPLST